jgi:hypothetical protein
VQSVSVLADKAIERSARYDKSVGLPLIVIKTIEAQGVTNPADVKRLKKSVLSELRRRSAEKRRSGAAKNCGTRL